MANILMEALRALREGRELEEAEDLDSKELIQSDSKEAFNHNLKVLLDSGKPRNQALAIAYSIQRKNAEVQEDIDWEFGSGKEAEELEKIKEALKKHNDENFWKNHVIYVEGSSNTMSWSAEYGYCEEHGFCSYSPESGLDTFENFNEFFAEITGDSILNPDTLEVFRLSKGQVEPSDEEEDY